MKILFVLENYYPKIGGVETLFKSLVDALVNQGHDITVLTNKGFGGLPIVSNSEGVKLVRVPLLNRYLFTFLAVLPALYHARGKDLIHTTSYNAAVPAFFAAKLMRKKIIITFHEVWGDLWDTLPYMSGFARFLHKSFEKMLLRFSIDKFIGVSQFTCDRLKEYGVEDSRIELIYNGIEYDQLPVFEKSSKEDKFIVSYFGRLGISKGLDLFLDAIELLKDQPGFHFNLIIPTFPNSFFKLIKDTIKDKKIGGRISLYHYLEEEDLNKVLSQSGAVIIPSYSEGFCFSAVESIGKRIPVISSGKGALKEVVSGKHLVVQRFDAEAFAQCMIAGKNDEWDESSIKKFHLQDTVQAYISLYEKMKE